MGNVMEFLLTLDRIRKMDNKELAFCLLKSDCYNQLPMNSPESLLIDEIVDRLYPEFDGETVTFEEWGWNTPEGEIRYF